MKQLSLTLLTLFFFQFLSAQTQFERLYRTDGRDQIGVDVQQTSDGGYLMLSISQNEDTDQLEKANVTKLNPKGNIQWSQDYEFDENLLPIGELLVLQQDSFLFAVAEEGVEMNKILTKADAMGEVVWSRAFGNPAFVPVDLGVMPSLEITTNYDLGASIFGQQGELSESGIYGARLDSLGNILWAKNYNLTPEFNTPPLNFSVLGVQDAQMTQDSGFILAGRTSDFVSLANILLTKLDSLGNIEWSKYYGFSSVFDAYLGSSVVQTPDLGYAVAGFAFTGDIPPSQNAILMKTDSLGEIEWVNTINVDSVFTTEARFADLELLESGNLLATGASGDSNSGFSLFTMEFTTDGEVVWHQKFEQEVTRFDLIGLTATSAGSGIQIATATDDGDNAISYLVKMEEDGSSSCSDTLSFLLTQVDTLPTFDIDFEVENLDTVLLKEPLVMEYDSFNVPVLALGSPPAFCEGEPINVTLDATVQGAVSYAWSTGETTPMITVTEEGMYTVDVRVEEDICFNLCDTTVIAVIGPPTVEIDPELGFFCLDGFGTLNANISGPANAIEWSTGEIGLQAIQITTPGTFSVTVTNQCGVGENSFSFTEFPQIPPTANIIADTSGLCLGGNPILTSAGSFTSEFLWATTDGIIEGDNTQMIIGIGSPGTYMVTNINFCGEATAEVTVFGEVPMPEIEIQSNGLCIDEPAVLFAAGIHFLADGVNWPEANQDSSLTIEVFEPGIYTVEATNDCFSATTSINVTTEGALPVVQANLDSNAVCVGGEAFLSVSGSNFFLETIEWSPVNEQGVTEISVSEEGTYFVSASNNCETVIDTVEVDCNFDIDVCVMVPNAFTPNGDESNDEFQAIISEECQFGVTVDRLTIWSRWGKKVFDGTGPNPVWDGTDGSDPATADVYIYRVEASTNDEIVFKEGDVTLIR